MRKRRLQPVPPAPDTTTESDPADVLARARRLDRNALALLHQMHYPEVYRYLNFRLSDENTCAEIAAQVFVQFLAALRKHRAPRQDLSGWLLRQAGRMVDGRLRKAEKSSPDLLTLPGVENTQQRSHFYAALQRLTLEEQHFLALRFSQPRTLSDVAQFMNKSEERTRMLQQRALHKLHQHLGNLT